MNTEFPPRLEGKFYLTEGGTETEVLYKWGFELPEFAMFPLLDDPKADDGARSSATVTRACGRCNAARSSFSTKCAPSTRTG
jgi:hypothetical protein